MNIYEFTLVLDGVEPQTKDLEDKLYSAGCDDALINFRNNTVYLDFDREADTLEDAVISAIKAIENTDLGAKVISVLPDNLVTESEIANKIQVGRQNVSLWVKGERRSKAPFPKPVSRISDKSPMWRWADVAKWLYGQNLIRGPEVIEQAKFIEDINAALEERNPIIKQHRHYLIEKLTFENQPRDINQ